MITRQLGRTLKPGLNDQNKKVDLREKMNDLHNLAGAVAHHVNEKPR